MSIPLAEYWRLLSAHLAPQRGRVALLAVLLLTGIGLQLVNPQVVRYFIDTAQSRGPETALLVAAGLFVGVALLGEGLSVATTAVSQTVAWTATNALRDELLGHALSLDLRFHNTHTPGELIERIDGDVTLIANFFSELVIQVLGHSLLGIAILVMLFRVDWRVGLTLTLFAALVLAVLNRLRGISTPDWIASRQASADLAGLIEDRLAGTEDIRSNRATHFVMHQFYRASRDLMLTTRRAQVRGHITAFVASLSFIGGLALGLGLGAYLYLRGEITLGTVYLTGFYAYILAVPVNRISSQLDDLQQAGAGVARIAALRDASPSVTSGPGARFAPGAPAITFDRVTFGYDPDEPVLRDVSFRMEPERVLGVVGRTGSGKTTITRLLFRLYDPECGAIRLDQTSIRAYRLDQLRRRIGLVTQDVQLFHATVRENLTFFDRSIGDDRIEVALDVLGIRDWVEALPQGLDTDLAGSSSLSAGEAQLLALTRVFLKAPEVVMLDEVSSRLDPHTERLLECAVDVLLRGRTAIIIAHRLSTVERADDILILAEGRVIEHGPRAKLAADRNSRFARLLRTGMQEELT